MFSRLSLALAVLLASSYANATPSDSCQWTLNRAKYHVHKVTNSSLQVSEYQEHKDGKVYETPVVHRLSEGVLILEQNCLNRMDGTYKERITYVPLNLITSLYGVNLRYLPITVYPSTTIDVHNLGGKPLSSLLDHNFWGGKLGVNISLIAGVNPNLSFAANSKAIIVADLEKWITLGLGLGLNVTSIKMRFVLQSARSTEAVDATALSVQGTQAQRTVLDPETARRLQF